MSAAAGILLGLTLAVLLYLALPLYLGGLL